MKLEQFLYHDVFGIGKITKINNKYIEVTFDNNWYKGIKTFNYDYVDKILYVTPSKKYLQREFLFNQTLPDTLLEKDKFTNIETKLNELNETYLMHLKIARDNAYLGENTKGLENDTYQLNKIILNPYFAKVKSNNSEFYIVKNVSNNSFDEFLNSNNIYKWNSDKAKIYYIKDSNNKLELKRHFDIEEAIYYGFTDEKDVLSKDSYLLEVLEENKNTNQIKDIIQTIEEEQYKIIEQEKETSNLVLGVAGSGKSQILISRISYLTKYDDFNLSDCYILSNSNLLNNSYNELKDILDITYVNNLTTNELYINLYNNHLRDYTFFKKLKFSKKLNSKLKSYFYSDTFNNKLSNQINLALKHEGELYKIVLKEALNELPNLFGFNVDLSTIFAVDKIFIGLLNILKRIELRDLKDFRSIIDNLTNISLDFNYNKNLYKENNRITLLNRMEDDIKEVQSYTEFLKVLFDNETYNKFMNIKDVTKLNFNINLKNYKKVIDFILDNKEIFETYLKKENLTISGFQSKIDIKPKEINYKDLKELVDYSLMKVDGNSILDIVNTYKSNYFDINFKRTLSFVLKRDSGIRILPLILKCALKPILDKYNLDESYDLSYVYFNQVNRLNIIPKFKNKYLFIDEFQDLTYSEINMLIELFDKKNINLYGDFNQQLTSGIKEDELDKLGINFNKYTLNTSYRNSYDVTKYINEELNFNILGVGVKGLVEYIDNKDILNIKPYAYITKENISNGNFNNVSMTNIFSNEKINVVTPILAKGLEFTSVLVDTCGMTKEEMYVSFSRAKDKLYILRRQ